MFSIDFFNPFIEFAVFVVGRNNEVSKTGERRKGALLNLKIPMKYLQFLIILKIRTKELMKL